jgi:UPF0755 protein
MVMIRFLIVLLVFLTIAVAAMAGVSDWAMTWFASEGPLQQEKIVVIPKGANVDRIAGKLQSEGVIDNANFFKIAVRLKKVGGNLKAGEFLFPAKVSAEGAITILSRGKAISRKVTIPEGRTVWDVIEILNAVEGLSGEIESLPAEGSLLAETYHFQMSDSRQSVIERMSAAMVVKVDELWASRVPDLPYKNKQEAIIMASIIEKETGVNSERDVVASVYINRLRVGMRLQADPTVIYGMTGGQGKLNRPLLRKDLKKQNPYNTYMNKGLPPGPIGNPGVEALKAALNPAETEFIFFVANGTGGHTFTKTLKEHNRAVQKWRKFKKSQKKSN